MSVELWKSYIVCRLLALYFVYYNILLFNFSKLQMQHVHIWIYMTWINVYILKSEKVQHSLSQRLNHFGVFKVFFSNGALGADYELYTENPDHTPKILGERPCPAISHLWTWPLSIPPPLVILVSYCSIESTYWLMGFIISGGF